MKTPSDIVTRVRGKGLLNAIVIRETKGKAVHMLQYDRRTTDQCLQDGPAGFRKGRVSIQLAGLPPPFFF